MAKYAPRKGARFTKRQAQALGETLERLGFQATPRQIVEEARSEESPIHELFPWNDKEAAESHRLTLARHYVNHLEVIVEIRGEEKRTKAFHSVEVSYGDTIERGYCSVEAIVEHDDLHAQVVRRALREVKYWKAKYQEYKEYPELTDIFKAIDRAEKKPKKRKRRKVAKV